MLTKRKTNGVKIVQAGAEPETYQIFKNIKRNFTAES